MKSLIFAALFFIASLFLIAIFRYNFGFIVVIFATILGFVTGKLVELQRDLKSLRDAFSRDWEQRHQDNQQAPLSGTDKPAADEPIFAQTLTEEDAQPVKQTDEQRETQTGVPDAYALKDSYADRTLSAQPLPAPQNNQARAAHRASVYTDKASATIKNYFTGGNLFVRIGIIILFFGVSFLLKYVSDRGLFPIEYRLMGVVVAAIFLLWLGWRLRHKKLSYALLLQGAGIGILYLDIYAAFSMYHLLSALPAFVLLFVVGMLSAALAVLQDAKSLAVLGFSGGFLAPVLASSGSNNPVGLFSYYALLNIAIVTIAWFKAWRPLNLLGFAFTFVIGSSWGVFSYTDDKFATTEPFLVLFFLFYVLIAVLFAHRQPPKLKGYVDGSLLFGVPLAASALQYALVKDDAYGVSISAFAMGAFYLALAWTLWKRAADGLRLLAEAFLALGVIYTSMAIPFALAPTQTAAAWGVEGLGLLWLGSRQQRLSVRIFGLLLQLGAGFFVFMRHDYSQDVPFLNGTFISALLMAIAGILSSRLLDKPFAGRQSWERHASPLLLVWGLLWLFGGFAHQIINHYGANGLAADILILAAFCSFGFTLAAQRLRPEWKHAWYAASTLIGIMLVVLLAQISHQSFHNALTRVHPLKLNGWLAWPLAFAAFYYCLKKLEQRHRLVRFQPLFHTLVLLLLVCVVTLEGSYHLGMWLADQSDWLKVWFAVPATLTLWLINRVPIWPLSAHAAFDVADHQSVAKAGSAHAAQETHGLAFGTLTLAAYLVLWGFQALVSRGEPAPLPWVPLLNPLDIMFGMVLIVLFQWWRSIRPRLAAYGTENRRFNKRLAIISFGALVFLWLNFTLFRMAHHWFEIAFNLNALYISSLVQTAVSILWAITGVLLTVYASHHHLRSWWLTGGVLLGLVVLKLFVIDLSELGPLARIISFLVVGVLLTSIGYFAPLPDRKSAADHVQDGNPREEKL